MYVKIIEVNTFIMMNNLDWVFLDVGGVLVDETKAEEIRFKNISDVVVKYGQSINRSEFDSLRIIASSKIGNLSENIIKILIPKSETQVAALNDLQKLSFPYYDLISVRPEAKMILDKLCQSYKLGLIANQGTTILKIFENENILRYFSHAGVSKQYSFHKPDIRLFESILTETKADPQYALFVDDNIERSLVPAKSLGFTTVWYQTQNRESLPNEVIDYTITSLNDLEQILLR